MIKKDVAAIVVTYNRLALLQECIMALRQQTATDLQIIVINNGSTDGTGDWLSAQEDIIIITQENRGGAGGFHTGLKYSAEHRYKYSWIMDDDTIPTANALEELLIAKSHLDDFGFLCSKVIDKNGNPCNYPVLDFKRNQNGEPRWLNMSQYNILNIVNATFVSVLINNGYIYKCGLPYSEFFIWSDDTEYTLRISDISDCYLVLKSIVLHKRKTNYTLSIFKESDNFRINNYFYYYRNLIFLSKKRSKIKVIGRYILSTIDLIRLLIRCQWKKAYIVLKALYMVFLFRPQIKFPES